MPAATRWLMRGMIRGRFRIGLDIAQFSIPCVIPNWRRRGSRISGAIEAPIAAWRYDVTEDAVGRRRWGWRIASSSVQMIPKPATQNASERNDVESYHASAQKWCDRDHQIGKRQCISENVPVWLGFRRKQWFCPCCGASGDSARSRSGLASEPGWWRRSRLAKAGRPVSNPT